MSEDLSADELLLLRQYRKTKADRYADGEWSISNGQLCKLWATSKSDIVSELSRIRQLRESCG